MKSLNFPIATLSTLLLTLSASLPPASAETLVEIRFDDADTDGTHYHDASGNGRDLTIHGPAVQSDDVPFPKEEAGEGNRSFLNAQGDLGGFGGGLANVSNLRLDTNQAFTIEGWVRWHRGAGGLCRITGPNLVIWLSWTAQGKVYVTHGSFTVVNTGIRLPSNEWTHLAYTFGDGQFTLYLNGEEQVTGEVTADDIAALSSSISTIHLFETDGVLYGGVDDFRLSDRALKPKELGFHGPLGRSAR